MNLPLDPRRSRAIPSNAGPASGGFTEWWQGMMRAWLATLSTPQREWLETHLSLRIPMPIASGGTGATTAEQARANLGIADSGIQPAGIPEPPADGKLYGRLALGLGRAANGRAANGRAANGRAAADTGVWEEVLPAESVRSGDLPSLPGPLTLSNANVIGSPVSNAAGFVTAGTNTAGEIVVLRSMLLDPGDYDLTANGALTGIVDRVTVTAPAVFASLTVSATMRFATGPEFSLLGLDFQDAIGITTIGTQETSAVGLIASQRLLLREPTLISLVASMPLAPQRTMTFSNVLPGGSPLPTFSAEYRLDFAGDVYFRRYQLEAPRSPDFAPGQLRAFYVSADGNDSNDGSRESPWKTVARVNAFAKQPGDAFMFRAGDTFTGEGIRSTTSGTAANPIFYRSYGDRTQRATLNLTTGANTSGIIISNAGYNRVSDLIVTGTDQNTFGVRLAANSPDMTKYPGNQLSNLEVSRHGITGVSIVNNVPGDADGSTPTTPPTINPGFSDLLIDNCVVRDNGDGIVMWSDWSRYTADPRRLSHRNVTVRNCVSYNNDGRRGAITGNGIVMSALDGGLCENCVAYGNGRYTQGGLGIWAYDANDITFRYCESYRNMSVGTDGGGFDIDGGCTNCVFEYCYSHDNRGAGLQYWLHEVVTPSHDNAFRFCISENDGTGSGYFSVYLGSSNSTGPTQGKCVFHNCVIYQSQDRQMILQDGSFYPVNAEFYNCIFVAAGLCWSFVSNPTNTTLLKFNGNNYANITQYAYTNMFWVTPAWTSYTLQGWRTATGQETLAAADTSRVWPHGLTNAGNGRTIAPVGQPPTPAMFAAWTPYQLTAASANRNAGLDIQTEFGISPGPRDMFGNTVNAATLSIGAHCP